jgi:hypothetical protein
MANRRLRPAACDETSVVSLIGLSPGDDVGLVLHGFRTNWRNKRASSKNQTKSELSIGESPKLRLNQVLRMSPKRNNIRVSTKRICYEFVIYYIPYQCWKNSDHATQNFG